MPLLLHTVRKRSWLACRSAPSALLEILFPSCVKMYLGVRGIDFEKDLTLGSTSRERRLMVGDTLAMFVEMIEETEKEMFVGDGEGDI